MSMQRSTDAAAFSALHQTCFETPWDEAAFADLLRSAGVTGLLSDHAFALIRAIADEAEILTLGVASAARGQGLGTQILLELEQTAAAAGARRIYLDVAEDAPAARALYARARYRERGRRRAYYARKTCAAADALTLAKPLDAGRGTPDGGI